MKTHLTIKNYRCFLEPVKIEIQKGFTAFIGINNVGKSTIMRFLLEFRELFGQLSQGKNVTESLVGGMTFSPRHTIDREEIFSNLSANSPIEIRLDFSYGEDESAPNAIAALVVKVSRDFTWRSSLFLHQDPEVIWRKGPSQGGNQKKVGLISSDGQASTEVDITAICELADILTKTLYIGPFRNTINLGTKTDYLDISVGESFIRQFDVLKTGGNKKENKAILTLTQKIQSIFGFNSLEISAADQNTTLQINVNNLPYKQHELGSGLLQFIIVLVNVYVKKPAYVLIDEPELGLHPTLQTHFLDTLGSFASEGVWFSTHSMGLARASAHKIYSIAKVGDGNSKVTPFAGMDNLVEFLGEMSFSSYKELGFEKILLVEGPTDIKVIQEFLRQRRSDKKFVIMPLHGNLNKNSTSELEELKRISTDIHVLIDSEKTSKDEALAQNRQDFVAVCAGLGISCHVLERRAMENYFPDYAVKEVFGPDARSLGPYEEKKAVPQWAKNLDWKLAAATKFEDIQTTDLGQFIDQLIQD